MIIVRLQGGLGNQMFQYAVGRALQKRRGDELRLDVTYLLHPDIGRFDVPREYSLDVFQIEPQFAYIPRLAARVPKDQFACPVGRVVREGVAIPRKIAYVREEPFGFHPEILSLNAPDVYLNGYWQSESYFAEIADDLRREFLFRHRLSQRGRELAEEIASVNAVCVNVRRGDLVSVESSRNALGFVGEEYYCRAEAWIKRHIPDARLYVSSDDFAWCRENLKFSLPVRYLDDCVGWKYGELLQLMSLCRHFVIPNSTFAWWAAWLGRSEGKRVACPQTWFRNESISAKDLIPAAWERL